MASAESNWLIRDGDRIVFHGDSITEQRLYTTFLESYITGRFPHFDFTFRNAGWGGDIAAKGLNRLERDVLSLKPTLVTLNQGMNDVKNVPPDAELIPWYIGNQAMMASILRREGARVIILGANTTDTDRHTVRDPKDLEAISDALMELAAREGIPAVDVFHPLADAVRRSKEFDEEIVLLPDGVHPSPAGHLVMAYIMLTSLGAPAVVAEITIDAKSGSAQAAGTKVSAVETNGDVSFTAKNAPLPMFIPDDAKPALTLVPAQDRINRHILRVTNLPAGNYEVRIDGEIVGEFRDTDLAGGINLSEYPTPMWRQAGELWDLIIRKNNIYPQRWQGVQLYPIPDWLADEHAEEKRHKEEMRLDAEIARFEGQITEAKQPVAHQFEVTPL